MWFSLFLAPVLFHYALSEYIPPGPAYRCPKQAGRIYPCNCTSEGDKGVNILCENTNLASIAAGLANLAREQILVDILTLSQCNIGRIYGNLLHSLQVRTLVLDNVPLSVIEDHTFIGVNLTLQVLNVSSSNFISYPATALQILGNLSTLILNSHNITKLESGSFTGPISNNLERLRITNGHINEIPIDVFASLRRLKTLDLHGNGLSALKKNQFKGLRDLESLDLSFNNITKIDATYFADLTKLGWCNMSHNNIQQLTRGTFARNTVLKVLNLSYNGIKKLDANSFRGMRFIRRLFLSDNEITDIGRGTFGSVSRIGTIDLARNKISKIDYQMFFQLNYVEVGKMLPERLQRQYLHNENKYVQSSSEIMASGLPANIPFPQFPSVSSTKGTSTFYQMVKLVDVSENEVTEIQKLAFKDLYLVTINVSHNHISNVEAGAFENCANITYLDMSNNEISSLPKTAFDSTTYATHLHLPHNNLSSLSQVPLQNMTGLKILNASFNEMTSIPKNSFPKLYELHTIDLSHNKLSTIANGVFQVLFSLRSLNLSHNKLKHIKSSVFGAVPTLLDLDLRYNQMKDVSRGALTRLASLRKINLAHNNLSSIFQIPISLSALDMSYNNLSSIKSSGDTWPTMNSLLDLDLSHNYLGDSLSKGSFAGLLTLQKLNLSYNNISKPPWEALSDLNSVQYLQFEGNSMTELSKNAFGRLPIVFELQLAKNNLQNISNRAFEGLLQLLSLNLSENAIKSIPNGAFQGLVSLRSLDLSHNLLEKIDNKTNGLLDDCLSLEKLNLSHNKISFVTRKTFPSDPYIPYRLREVDLSYNTMPVLTYEITFGTKKVEKLNVSYNAITEIRSGVIGNLTSLRIIDLSNNQLTSIDTSSLPENVTALYFSDNTLTTLPTKEIMQLKGPLSVLDFRNNKLRDIPPQFVTLLENKTDLKFNGNPITCDCSIRPVLHWLKRQLITQESWKEVSCDGSHIQSALVDVDETELECPRDFIVNETFNVLPDIRFREVSFLKNGGVSLKWFVTSLEDIADFYLFIEQQDSQSRKPTEIIYEKLIAYSERSLVLTAEQMKKQMKQKPHDGDQFKLCMVALDSFASPRQLFDSQCKKVTYSQVKKFLSSSAISTKSWVYSVCFLFSIIFLI